MTSDEPSASAGDGGYTVAIHDSATGEYAGTLLEDERIEALLLDDRTIVFAENTKTWSDRFTPASTHTPTTDQVQAVIDTIGSAPELEWASGHTRFLRGDLAESDGSIEITANFGCGLPALTDALQAMTVLREEVLAVTGGGTCYGWAIFTADGELLRSSDNGES